MIQFNVYRKTIFQWFGRLKSKKKKIHLDINHGHDTVFSKLVNLTPVKRFCLVSTPDFHLCFKFCNYANFVFDHPITTGTFCNSSFCSSSTFCHLCIYFNYLLYNSRPLCSSIFFGFLKIFIHILKTASTMISYPVTVDPITFIILYLVMWSITWRSQCLLWFFCLFFQIIKHFGFGYGPTTGPEEPLMYFKQIIQACVTLSNI